MAAVQVFAAYATMVIDMSAPLAHEGPSRDAANALATLATVPHLAAVSPEGMRLNSLSRQKKMRLTN